MKILLIKYRNIGDVLLSTPLINNLKENYPDAQIDFALNDYCKEMISLNPNITNIYPYKRSYYKSLGFFKRFVEELKYFKNIISQNYDIIINLTEGERGAFISMFSSKSFSLGYQLNNDFINKIKPYNKVLNKQIDLHVVKNDLNFSELLGKEVLKTNVSIYWDKEHENRVDEILKENFVDEEFIQIHPVSRWMFKCWDDKRFAKIIDYIQGEKNLKVLITSSDDPIESKKVEDIISLCKTKPINLIGKFSLKELACFSSKAKLFVGIDSAPMHIAAAVNTPVIALFGASYPQIWGPWDNNANKNYEYKDGIQKVGLHTIFSSTNKKIYLNSENLKVSEGMMEINYEDIEGIIDEYL